MEAAKGVEEEELATVCNRAEEVPLDRVIHAKFQHSRDGIGRRVQYRHGHSDPVATWNFPRIFCGSESGGNR